MEGGGGGGRDGARAEHTHVYLVIVAVGSRESGTKPRVSMSSMSTYVSNEPELRVDAIERTTVYGNRIVYVYHPLSSLLSRPGTE